MFQVLSLGLNEVSRGRGRRKRGRGEICRALELEALLARDFSRLSGEQQGC